ncbi:hypothetical protein GCM10023186_20060 [Hymenobacter koreensis]|uniref:SbsA Ig-like domain-containing protein n=1 Tax=Hymenobacter koreensis TaxID=1084523 RepID=A0ABP8IYY0_9BACT
MTVLIPGITPLAQAQSTRQPVIKPADHKEASLSRPDIRTRRERAAPALTALSPAPNQPNAPRTSNVAATFSEPLSNTAATRNALVVFSAQRGGKLSGTAAVSGSTLTFDPATDFRAGETVSATITTAVQGTSGDVLPRSQVFQFKAAVSGGERRQRRLRVAGP